MNSSEYNRGKITELSGVAKIVPLHCLVRSPLNSRTEKEQEDSDDFVELVESIRTNGLLEPIIVRPWGGVNDKYEIVAGSRRYHALKVLKETKVMIVVRQDLTDVDARIFSIIENIHRKKLSPDELEQALQTYFRSTIEYWQPHHPTIGERVLIENEGLVSLAKSYLSRMHNEESKEFPVIYRKNNSVIDEPKNTRKTGGNRGKARQEVYPTDEFRDLAKRVGLSFSKQYNVLRGYGPFKEKTNYLSELSDEAQRLIDEEYRKAVTQDPELEKEEEIIKQKMAHAITLKQGKGKTKQNYESRAKAGRTKSLKSKSEKLKRSSGIIAKVIEEEKKSKKAEKEYNKKLEQEKTDKDFKWEVTTTKPKSQKIETEVNPSLAREQIMNLCPKLFKFLTGMELDIFELDHSELQAKSRQAKDNMIEIATHYADTQEIAGLQHIIIPTNQALTIFRDLVYESVESKNKQDEIFKE